MAEALSVQVAEDWRRDALVLTPYRQTTGGTYVGQVGVLHAGAPPHFSLTFRPHDASAPDDAGEMGLSIQVDIAHALYEALGRHFGHVQDPASRELVDTLKVTYAREAARVDLMLQAVLPSTDPRTDP